MQRYMPDSSTEVRDENDAYEYSEVLLERVLKLTRLVDLRPDPRHNADPKKKHRHASRDASRDASRTRSEPQTKEEEKIGGECGNLQPHSNTYHRHQIGIQVAPAWTRYVFSFVLRACLVFTPRSRFSRASLATSSHRSNTASSQTTWRGGRHVSGCVLSEHMTPHQRRR